MLPYFICIGTYRAGTTWLHKMLSCDSRIYLPHIKETMFFSHHWDRGANWYLSLFNDAKPTQYCGEICPTYLSSHETPRRISDIIKSPKIIVILRNPITQILSLYKLWLVRGYTNQPLSIDLIRSSELLDNVMYATHLDHYSKFFQKEDIGVFQYEDLSHDPEIFLKSIYCFLGIPPHIPEQLTQKTNAARTALFPIVDKTIASVGDYLRHHNCHFIHKAIKTTGIVDLLKTINSKKTTSLEIEEDVSEFIIEQTKSQFDSLAENYDVKINKWLR